jgi:hypothetical protein
VRVLVLIKADERTEGGEVPAPEYFEQMREYNENLVKSGVMLAGEGLHPSSRGARVHFSTDGRTTIVDGPFTEAKELIAGFWLWQVSSMDEAIEWVKRIPDPKNGQEGNIEIREVFELDGQDGQ